MQMRAPARNFLSAARAIFILRQILYPQQLCEFILDTFEKLPAVYKGSVKQA